MASMAYRGCLFMHWCPECAFYGAKSSKLDSVPRTQAVSPAAAYSSAVPPLPTPPQPKVESG